MNDLTAGFDWAKELFSWPFVDGLPPKISFVSQSASSA
jgi:hypothetical protein